MYYIAQVYKLFDPNYHLEDDSEGHKVFIIDRNFAEWCKTLINNFGVPQSRRSPISVDGTLIYFPINIYTILNNKFYSDYTTAKQICDIQNKTTARRDSTGYILGYVVCNTASPQFNIYGMNCFGEKRELSSYELQPLEVSRMAVNFYNDNFILNTLNTEAYSVGDQLYQPNDIVRYTYFMPKGIGQ